MDNNNNKVNDLLALLSPTVPNNPDVVQIEPLTYHRRGHWFKSSIAQGFPLYQSSKCIPSWFFYTMKMINVTCLY